MKRRSNKKIYPFKIWKLKMSINLIKKFQIHSSSLKVLSNNSNKASSSNNNSLNKMKIINCQSKLKTKKSYGNYKFRQSLNYCKMKAKIYYRKYLNLNRQSKEKISINL